jgi:AraC-like DNA-binding protein
MDPISDVLTAIRVADFALFDGVESWDFAEKPGIHAYLGMISRGGAWLDIKGQRERLVFATGDCFLILSGAAHRLVGDAGEAVIITGVQLTFDETAGTLLADLMPKVLHAHADQTHSAEMRTALELIASEAAAPGPGSEMAIQRLTDVFLIHAIRSHLEAYLKSPASGNGYAASAWLRALVDPQLGAALKAMHERIEHPWTVMALASAAGMSRSAFAMRFKVLIGEAPLEYLTRWRMYKAGRLLRDDTRKLYEVASSVGYDSGGAFHKAFKRVVGVTPGAYRRTGSREIRV